MSTLKTNNIEHLDASSASIQTTSGGGVIFAGISTFQSDANFDANVNIAGTITYEDVSSVDSVGIITAQSGIHVTGGSVGVGTNNPGGALHVDSKTTNVPLIVQASQNNRARLVFRNNQETGTECVVELIDEDLRFNTNSGERMRIVKDGNIGIGLTDPERQLTLSHASQAEIGLLSGADTSGGLIYHNASEQKVLIANRESDGHISFQSGGVNERMRIDSSGKIGIGTDFEASHALLEVEGSNVFTGSASNLETSVTKSAFRVKGATNSSDSLWIGVENVNAEPYIQGCNGNGTNAKDITLNPYGGSVGIGTDNPVRSLHLGDAVSPTFLLSGTAPQVRFNSSASDSSDNDRVIIGRATASDQFISGSADGDAILRCATSKKVMIGYGTTEIAQFNSNGLKFKTSGMGIDFSETSDSSGTMSSELLDDYEEGTWTPTITGLGDHTNTAASTWGKYTKIGNRVFITWRYSWTSRSTTNGGVVFLASLPFNAADDSQNSAVYIGGIEGLISNSGREVYGGNVLNDDNKIQFRASGHDVSENSLFGSLSTSLSSGYIYGGANYIVD